MQSDKKNTAIRCIFSLTLCFLSVDKLNKLFPNLTDTLAEMENQNSQLPSTANMSGSIMKIKDMIKKTRELTNTVSFYIISCIIFPKGINKYQNLEKWLWHCWDLILKSSDSWSFLCFKIRGPILFSGESHIELHSPKNLVDLQAFTAIDLMLHRPKRSRRAQRQSEEEENLFVLYLGNKNVHVAIFLLRNCR